MVGRSRMFPVDIVGKSKLWLTIGSIVMLLGIIGMIPPQWTHGLTPGKINFGLDFTGGAEFTYKLPKKLAIGIAAERRVSAKIRSELAKEGLLGTVIQISEGNIVTIRTQAKDEEQAKEHRETISKVMNRIFKGVTQESVELIGPVIGRELKINAIKATVLGLIGMLIYIWVRYDPLFAIGAIIALIHDVLAVLAFVSFTKITINSPFVAVLLTVVGYSINDTVIIFDRIRENMKKHKEWSFYDVANQSIVETIARSINTLLTTEFPLWTILLFGGMAAKDFALPLLVGLTSGGYSSIFIATPIVLVLRKLFKKEEIRIPRPVPAKAAPVSPQPAQAEEPQEELEESKVLTPVSAPTTTPAGVPVRIQHAKKKKRKKKKRRH